jgi:hypothetical protein
MTARKFAVALVAGFAFAVAGIATVSAETIEIVGSANGCATAFAELSADDGTPYSSITVSCPRPPVQVARR